MRTPSALARAMATCMKREPWPGCRLARHFRGLHREDMSPTARMMAVADIFAALTAADRPYKSGKRLSEALHIMARMCREQHIDAVQIENYLH